MSSVIQRFLGMPRGGVDPGARVVIERGTIADYDALAHYHYRARRPATCCCVLRAVEPPDPAALAPGRSATFPARAGSGELVGVLVVSYPTLNGRWRTDRAEADGADGAVGADRAHQEARRRRASTQAPSPPLAQSARSLNSRVRTISRLVVRPRWRGLGVGARLVRAYLARPLTPQTEAVAAMGDYCPVFEAAGMRRVSVGRGEGESRLARALAEAGLEPWDLLRASRGGAALGALLERAPAARRALTAWAWRWRPARGAMERGDLRAVARLAAMRLAREPVVYMAGLDAGVARPRL